MKATDVKTADVMQWAKDEIQRQGVLTPKYPDDQTTIDEAELSEYMREFSAMYSWATRLLGLTEAELHLVENEVNLYVDAKKPTVKAEGRVTKEVAAAIILSTDEHIGEAYESLQRLSALHTMLEAVCRACDKSFQALSRDLSRREIEIRKRM